MRPYRLTQIWFLWILLPTLFLSTGCRKHFSLAAPPAPKVLDKTEYSLDDYKKDLETYVANTGKDAVDAQLAFAKQTRDKIVYSFMAEIDNVHGQYTVTLYSGKGTLAVVGDGVELGLTAAATIATHTPTKTILSALATGLTGLNLSFDKNFFAQQTFQAIAIAMQTRRDKARESITANLDKGVRDYPLSAARRELVAYFYAGTLPGGLQELQEEAGAAAKQQSQTKEKAIH